MKVTKRKKKGSRMKCFTACFRTTSNHKKIMIKPCSTTSSSYNKINSISPQVLQDLLKTHENGEAFVAINDTKEEARCKIVNPINLFEESKDEEEEQELNKRNRKNLLEDRENGESKKNEENELNGSGRKKVTFELNVSMYDEVLLANQVSANCSEINPSNLQKQDEEEANEVSNSSVSSYISYPPNHRYHCCRNSVDEFEDIDLEDDADNNNNENDDDVERPGNGLMIQEESSSNESLFSLSIDSTRRVNNPTPEMDENKEVSSPLKQSVLNPIRSLSLLKDTSIATSPSLLKRKNQQEKENIDMNLLDFSNTYNQRVQEESSLKRGENEVAVDTSLSSWLVESSQEDTTPNSKMCGGSVGNSPPERSVRPVDRQILGALTVEKVKDEKNIVIGTVGSYLRHTGQATGISSY